MQAVKVGHSGRRSLIIFQCGLIVRPLPRTVISGMLRGQLMKLGGFDLHPTLMQMRAHVPALVHLTCCRMLWSAAQSLCRDKDQ